jgi:hypothetical protein
MSIRDDLEASNALWLEAFSRGDAEACADLYTEDGAIHTGRDQVVRFSTRCDPKPPSERRFPVPMKACQAAS